jgi:hypothetical protein
MRIAYIGEFLMGGITSNYNLISNCRNISVGGRLEFEMPDAGIEMFLA